MRGWGRGDYGPIWGQRGAISKGAKPTVSSDFFLTANYAYARFGPKPGSALSVAQTPLSSGRGAI